MKYTNKKRGFTIVELIIVVAVIGILAAVLIPTFSSLIRKAQVAADETLIKNLNTALAMDTTSKHETMTQALEATKANGFDVEKIEARATENKIVWDSLNDCFAYIESGKTAPTYIPDSQPNGKAENYQLWVIVQNGVADENYSSYFAGTDLTAEIIAGKGVDVGENTGITAITYTNTTDIAQTVVIRTNSTTTALEINAPKDNVKHYGAVGDVDVVAVDKNNSYHENGSVDGKITLTVGNLVIEQNAEVKTVVVNSTSIDDFSIEVNVTTSDNAPQFFAESDSIANGLKNKITASEEIKNSNVQTAVYTKHVSTVAELTEALNTNGEVILDSDLVLSAIINHGDENNTEHNVVLNLNGKSITTVENFVGRPIHNYGTLTVVGNGTIDSSASLTGYGAIRNFNKLTIENGTFKGNLMAVGATIDNQLGAEVVINGGKFIGSAIALNNGADATATVNGGSFEGTSCSGCTSNYYHYTIRNIGNMIINDCEVTGVHGALAAVDGELIVNGGSFKTIACPVENSSSSSHYALAVMGEVGKTSCIINGGTFESVSKWAVHVGNDNEGDGGNREKAFITINGGTFKSNDANDVINVATVTGDAFINGGVFNKNKINGKDLQNFIASGKTVVEENGQYYVK